MLEKAPKLDRCENAEPSKEIVADWPRERPNVDHMGGYQKRCRKASKRKWSSVITEGQKHDKTQLGRVWLENWFCAATYNSVDKVNGATSVARIGVNPLEQDFQLLSQYDCTALKCNSKPIVRARNENPNAYAAKTNPRRYFYK